MSMRTQHQSINELKKETVIKVEMNNNNTNNIENTDNKQLTMKKLDEIVNNNQNNKLIAIKKDETIHELLRNNKDDIGLNKKETMEHIKDVVGSKQMINKKEETKKTLNTTKEESSNTDVVKPFFLKGRTTNESLFRHKSNDQESENDVHDIHIHYDKPIINV